MTPPSSRSTMWGTVTAWPFPLLTKGRHGYSEPYRWKISGEARHCCHACPDLSHSAQYTVPTTPACTTQRRTCESRPPCSRPTPPQGPTSH